jgi:hypothetical protein
VNAPEQMEDVSNHIHPEPSGRMDDTDDCQPLKECFNDQGMKEGIHGYSIFV